MYVYKHTQKHTQAHTMHVNVFSKGKNNGLDWEVFVRTVVLFAFCRTQLYFVLVSSCRTVAWLWFSYAPC